MADDQVLMHASCVAVGERGILIIGPPGSGKSDLVLRLIDIAGYGTGNELQRAQLVSDDQTLVVRRGGRLFASAPATIAGKLEIRGFGIIDVPHERQAALDLAVRLLPAAEIERMPATASTLELCGVVLPEVTIDAASVSAPARLRAALGHIVGR